VILKISLTLKADGLNIYKLKTSDKDTNIKK
jgi:hypothetical protein